MEIIEAVEAVEVIEENPIDITVTIKAQLIQGKELTLESFAYLEDCMNVSIVMVRDNTPPKNIIGLVDFLFYELELMTKITRQNIVSKKRNRPLVYCRSAIAAILKWQHGLTLKDIGAIIGDRDHTSVIHALRETRHMIETDCDSFKPYADFIFQYVKGIPTKQIA